MAATKRRASSSMSPTGVATAAIPLDMGSSKRRRIGLQNAFVSRLLPQLPRHGLRRIAPRQNASSVAQHDQPARILGHPAAIDRSGDRQVVGRSMISSWPAPSPPSLKNSTEYLPSICDTMPLPDSAVAADSLCGAPVSEQRLAQTPTSGLARAVLGSGAAPGSGS